MRMRKKKWAVPELQSCGFFVEQPEQYKGRWREAFPHPDYPICLELGCGKGSFAAQMGIAYEQTNFLAIDLIMFSHLNEHEKDLLCFIIL